MKLLLLALALSTALTATAGDTVSVSAKGVKPVEHDKKTTVPLVADPQWKISAKEYAELLEECGQTTNYGLATDESPVEARTRLASNERR